MSFSERLYRVLLRAYPRDYRNRYAQPMEQLFRDRLSQVRTFTELLALWRQMLADWMFSVPARYCERVKTPIHSSLSADAFRQCLFFARCEASSFYRREITLEHLLLGLLRVEPALVSRVALESMVHRIEASEPAGRRVAGTEDVRLGDEAARAVALATEIARTAGRPQVSPADLAEAILREENTLAACLLREHISRRL